jgi:hypothetical protein
VKKCRKHKTDTSAYNPRQMALWLKMPCTCDPDASANPAAMGWRRRKDLIHILAEKSIRDELAGLKAAMSIGRKKEMNWTEFLTLARDSLLKKV